MKTRQTKLYPSPYDDLALRDKVLKHRPSSRLRCGTCGKYRREQDGKFLQAPTTIPVFTCFKCIEKYGEDNVVFGYEHL